MIPTIKIYTDGSCHTQQCGGAWVAIVFIDGLKYIISGAENNTTHNRMELLAVIKALEFILDKHGDATLIEVISDSQYVVGLLGRKHKFEALDYNTKKGNPIRNVDLVQQLLSLVTKLNVSFTKIKAHQQKTLETQYNIEADLLCRKLVRDTCYTNVCSKRCNRIRTNTLVIADRCSICFL